MKTIPRVAFTLASLGCAITTAPALAQTCATTTDAGSGCPDSSGITPSVTIQGDFASAPHSLNLAVHDVVGSGFVSLIGESSVVPLTTADCTLWVNTEIIVLPFVPDATGSFLQELPFSYVLTSPVFLTQVVAQDSSAASGWTTSNAIQVAVDGSCVSNVALVAALAGSNPSAANAAYGALYEGGIGAIEVLVGLLEDAARFDEYKGSAPIHPRSGVNYQAGLLGDPAIGATNPAIGAVAMYLIDSIYYAKPCPYMLPALYSPTNPQWTEFDKVLFASQEYVDWFANASAQTLLELRDIPDPLSGSTIEWALGLQLTDAEIADLIGLPSSSSDVDY